MSIMLTFVLLYIIIITNLGVITPTYVYTYVSIYQILCSGRFRWEQYALIKKEMSVHCSHFTSLVGRWVTSHLLISFFSGYSPCSPSVYHHRWVSRKEAFFKNGCLERTAIRLCKRDTRKCVFFAWIMLTFDFLCSIIVLLRSHPLL